MSEIAISVNQVSKKYQLHKQGNSIKEVIPHWFQGKAQKIAKNKDFWALQNITFEVQRGEVLGIIGKNGAGKSTLLKILSRITLPTQGRIEMDASVSSLLEVGTGFHPDLSGRENIFINGILLGMKRQEIRKHLDEIIDFAGVKDFINIPVKKYSSGMRMRLAFAVAAFLQSDILLLDEVLSVGDIEFQKKCLNKVEDSRQQGRTILIASHNMGLVGNVAQQVVWLHQGKIKEIGSTETVVKNYLNFSTRKSSNHSGIFYLEQPELTEAGISKVETYCDEQLSDKLYTGHYCSFKIHFFSKKPLQEILLGIIIKDQVGKPFITLNNAHLNIPLKPSNPLRGSITIDFQKLLLFAEGKYFVDLYLGDNYAGHSFKEITEAFHFYIVRSNVYNSPSLMDTQRNVYYQPDISFYCN